MSPFASIRWRLQWQPRRQVKGFTLIELVTVIVLMSIISLAGVKIISFSVQAFEKMQGRQSLGYTARIAIDRISRELRSALPNTVRVLGNCIEFIPINAGGTYLDLPLEGSALSFQAVAFNPGQDATSGRVVVYPMGDESYDLASNVMSGVASSSIPDVDNQIQVTMPIAHQFPRSSPGRRFFLVAEPISYCLDGDYLFRYQGYGLSSTQLSITGLPSALPNRALLADHVGASSNPFTVIDQSLQRNAIVEMNLTFTDGDGIVKVTHEVQLRNVP